MRRLKGADNPSFVYLILTDHFKCCKNAGFCETGKYEFHILTSSVLKAYFQKAKQRTIRCMHLDDNDFRDELIRDLSSNNLEFDCLAQFTNFSKITFEKSWKTGSFKRKVYQI